MQLSIPNIEDFGAVGVDIFFVISGFVITLLCTGARRITIREFLYRRVCRVYPPYLMVTAVIAAWVVVSGKRLDLYTLTRSILLLPPLRSSQENYYLAIGWTLAFEIWFYLIAAVGLYAGRKWFFTVMLGAPTALVALGQAVNWKAPLFVFLTMQWNWSLCWE